MPQLAYQHLFYINVGPLPRHEICKRSRMHILPPSTSKGICAEAQEVSQELWPQDVWQEVSQEVWPSDRNRTYR